MNNSDAINQWTTTNGSLMGYIQTPHSDQQRKSTVDFEENKQANKQNNNESRSRHHTTPHHRQIPNTQLVKMFGAMGIAMMALLGIVATGPATVEAAGNVVPKHTGMTYSEMMLRAGKWSTTIGNLNPNHLTNVEKMKGIKHFVEYLSLLEELVHFGNSSVREWALEKVEEAVQVGGGWCVWCLFCFCFV